MISFNTSCASLPVLGNATSLLPPKRPLFRFNGNAQFIKRAETRRRVHRRIHFESFGRHASTTLATQSSPQRWFQKKSANKGHNLGGLQREKSASSNLRPGPAGASSAPSQSTQEEEEDSAEEDDNITRQSTYTRGNDAIRPLSRSAPMYNVVRIDRNGTLGHHTLPRRDLLQSTGLQPRDLRRIDPLLSLTSSSPVIVVRDTFLLVHVSAIRLAIFSNYCILFHMHAKVTDNFIANICNRLQSCNIAHLNWDSLARMTLDGSLEVEPVVEEADVTARLEGREESHEQQQQREMSLGGPSSGSQPFELIILETALYNTTRELEDVLEGCTARVASLLRELPSSVNATFLDELRVLKQELVGLDTRAGSVRQLLLEVLEDDEDVEGILISRWGQDRPRRQREKDMEEVEGMLEYYLQRCEAYHSEAERLLENTRDLEESIRVSLSARRFEVNKLELWLSIATFAISCGALITGIFGMNLLSGVEMHPTLFYWTCLGIFVGIVLITSCIFVYMSSRLYTHARTKTPKTVLKRQKSIKKVLKAQVKLREEIPKNVVYWNESLKKDIGLGRGNGEFSRDGFGLA